MWTLRSAALVVLAAGWCLTGLQAAPETDQPSPEAVRALDLIQSHDPYQQQLGFFRLEALRERAVLPKITPYLTDRDPDRRAYTLRALVAIEGSEAIPLLLERLKQDRASQVRRAALLGLEPFQTLDERILAADINALRDRSPEVRIVAVDLVSRINNPRARQAILLRKRWELNRDVRRAITLAVKRLAAS